jgi:ferritin-like protein
VPEINRGQFLRLGVAGAVGTVGAGLLAGPAAAALPAPTPQGDDVGFLSFAAVAEQASRAWYGRALRVRGFSAGDRRRLQTAQTAKGRHLARINAALGADAIQPGDFEARFPAAAFATTDRAIGLGRRIEEVLVATYLNGTSFSRDSGTRLLLGRLLTYDAQMLAWMRGLTGAAPAGGLPNPLSLEQAGRQLDLIITTPNFPV